MTVQQLIHKLSQYPLDAEVKICADTIQVLVQQDINTWEPDMDDFGTCDIADTY